MCTVTWRQFAGGYELFMNRDELYSRGRALPPRKTVGPSLSYLAPVDTDAGGSWIAVNSRGLTVCLLNHYPRPYPEPPAEPRSRGLLVLDAAQSATIAELEQMMAAQDHDRYRPFTLLVLAPGQPVRSYRWDGAALVQREPVEPPITSSGVESARVVPRRLRTYRELVGDEPTTQRLQEFHRSRVRDDGAGSVCVRRPDGGTRAYDHVLVESSGIRFEHLDGSPCEPDGTWSTHELARDG